MRRVLFILLLPLTIFGQSQKISDMTSATSLTGSEYVPIVQTTNKKSTVTLLRGWDSTIGTAGQLLKVNSGATALEFFSPNYISTYPGAGIPLSTGSAWGTSITDNSSNWNTAFGWGNHASAGYLTSLSNGNGTTANGSAVDLGGTLTGDVLINGPHGVYFGGPFTTLTAYESSVSNDPTRFTNFILGDNIAELSVSVSGASKLLNISNLGVTLNLGSDATGDTYYRNSSGYFTRLPVGTNGHVLTLSGGLPSWAAPSGGTWGSITGTLSSQTDLQTALDAKLLKSGDTYTTTTGNGLALTSSTVTSGSLVSLSNTGTAAASNTKKVLNVSSSGANTTSTQTTYGGYFSNTNTGTSSTNIALYAEASGATNNFAISAPTGKSRLGDLIIDAASITTNAGSTRITLNGATSGAIGVAVGNGQTYTSAGGMNAIISSMNWTSSAATGAFSLLTIGPTINVTSGTGTLYGAYYNPTLTSVAGISNHYAFYASSGDLVIASGNASISSTLNVGSNYTSQGQIIQNVGVSGSDVYRRKVEWTPVTASGSSGNFDFNIFNTDVIQNSTCTVTITVTGVNSSGVKSYAKEMKATFRKPGTSDPVQVGSTTDIYEHSNDLTTPTSSVSASTDFCRVSYDSGTGAPTLRWTVFIETKYSTN